MIYRIPLCLSLLLTSFSASANQAHDAIVVVLDGSGSMRDTMASGKIRMDAAKVALKAVLAQTPADTYVGLAVFGKTGTNSHWVFKLQPRSAIVDLNGAIEKIEPGGRTPLGRFLKIAADALLADRDEQFGYGTHRMLVVTDGQASDPKFMQRYAPEVVARGLTLDVIGVDMEETHPLAAQATSYRSADNPTALTQAIEEVFAEISSGDIDNDLGENAFELAAAFEPEMALDVISALHNLGNHPIGTKAPQGLDSASSQTQETKPKKPNAEAAKTSQGSDSEGLSFATKVLFAAALLLIFLRLNRKKKKK